MARHTSIDEYLADCDETGRERLLAIRGLVHEIAPSAGETISYAIPTFTLDGRALIHAAAWKQHVSLYPVPDLTGDDELRHLFTPYAVSKGTVKFRHRDPLPLDVIRGVIEARLRQHPPTRVP
jgi:uncharacterized protein YdhG (YjbR/CyaY superfamily)